MSRMDIPRELEEVPPSLGVLGEEDLGVLTTLAELLAFARREDIRVVGLSDLPEVLAP